MDELIKALRNCACIKTDASCANCGYARSTECKWRMIEDAADAIEKLTKEIKTNGGLYLLEMFERVDEGECFKKL